MKMVGKYATAAGATIALLFTTLSAAPSGAQESDPQRHEHVDRHGDVAIGASRPRVRLDSSSWTVQSTRQRMPVRVRYLDSTPPDSYIGKPVDVQVQSTDGSWRTAGRAEQRKVAGKPVTEANVGFRFPETGRVLIRARAHPDGGRYRSSPQLVTVQAATPAYNPRALPKTGNFCAEPSIVGPRRIAYGCGDTIGTPLFDYDHKAGERKRFARGSFEPVLADNAEFAVSVRSLNHAQNYRVRRTNLESGQSYPVARRRGGKPAYTSYSTPSISANGKRTVYVSEDRGIVAGVPRGANIYLKRAGKPRSRFVAHGDDPEISGNGRFVVWRTADGRRIRRTNLRTTKTITIRRVDRSRSLGRPRISRSGRYITYRQTVGGTSRVRVFDAAAAKPKTIGTGGDPSISARGDRIVYRADADLYAWQRGAGTSTLISVGRDGNGSNGIDDDFPHDLSANGRWLIAVVDSPLVAPDNGRTQGQGRNDLVLFDLRSLD